MNTFPTSNAGGGTTGSEDNLKLKPVVSLVVQVVVCTWTLVANGLVLVTVCGSNQLRSVMTAFLISLAVADFLLGLAMALSSAITPLTPLFWPCMLVRCVIICQYAASIWSLVGVALDRYLHIVAHRLKWRITEFYARIGIVSIWIVATITAIVPMIMGHIKSSDQFEDVWICIDFVGIFDTRYLKCIVYMHGYVPLLLTILLYTHIIWILLKRTRRVDFQAERDRSAAGELAGSMRSSHESKVVIKLVILQVVFIVCVLPLMIGILFKTYNPAFHNPPIVRFSMVVLVCFNSAVNPILYWFTKSQFRKSCGRLLRRAWHKITSPPFCPRPKTQVHGIHLGPPAEVGLAGDPSLVPTINVTTYHCDEAGCKRVQHRENIHQSLSDERDGSDKCDEGHAGSGSERALDLPGKVGRHRTSPYRNRHLPRT